MTRSIAVALALLVGAASGLAQTNYGDHDASGLVATGGGAGGGVSVEALAPADASWVLLTVAVDLGITGSLSIELNDVEIATSTTAESHYVEHLLETYYDIGDLLAIDVVLSDGVGSLLVFDADVAVAQSGGLSVTANALGPGLPVEFDVVYESPYPVTATFDVTLTGVGGHAAETYRTFDTAATSFRWSDYTGDDSYTSPGETLTISVDATHANGDPTTGVLSDVSSCLYQAGPANVTAAATGDGEVTVTWNSLHGAEQYTVYRRVAGLGLADVVRVVGSLSPTAGMSYDESILLADGCSWWNHATKQWHYLAIASPGAWGDLDVGPLTHQTSPDLATWTQHADITPEDIAGEDGVLDGYDITHLWAPHVVFHDGYWHLFVTGVDRTVGDGSAGYNVQRIFYARAKETADLTNPDAWTDAKFVLDGDSAGGETPPTGITGPTYWQPGTVWSADCRDPFVVWDDTVHRWVMLVTVQRAQYVGCLGVAVADAIDGPWDLLGYYSGSDYAGKAESAFAMKSPSGAWQLGFIDNVKYSMNELATLLGPLGVTTPIADHDYAFNGSLIEPVSPVFLSPGTASPDYSLFPTGGSLGAAYFTFRHANGAHDTGAPAVLLLHGDVQSPDTYDQDATSVDAQLVTYTGDAVVSSLTFTDTHLQDGGTYTYYVAAGTPTARASCARASNNVTAYADATLRSVTASIVPQAVPTRISIAVDDTQPLQWEYSFMAYASADPVADFDGLIWSAWTPVDGSFTSSATVSYDAGTDYGEYFHAAVRTRSQASPNDYDDIGYGSVQRPYPIPTITPVMAHVGGGLVTVDWADDGPNHPDFSHYVLRYLKAGDPATETEISLTGTHYEFSATSGTWLGYVRCVLGDGTEGSEGGAGFAVVP
jgi:hypothetical protein